jgi:hypothetical protein
MKDANDMPRMLTLDEALKLELMAKEEVWVIATDHSLDLRGVTRPVLEHNLDRGIKYKILVPKVENAGEKGRDSDDLAHALLHEMTTEKIYDRPTGRNAEHVRRHLSISTLTRPRFVPLFRVVIVDPHPICTTAFASPTCIMYFNDEGFQKHGNEFRLLLPIRLSIQTGQDFVEYWNANQKMYGEQSVIEPPLWTLHHRY